jgi:hypothetical protein
MRIAVRPGSGRLVRVTAHHASVERGGAVTTHDTPETPVEGAPDAECLPEDAMFQNEGDADGSQHVRWPWWRPPEPDAAAFRGGEQRFFVRVGAPKDSEGRTREFLAREVYGVPEAWLDEVLRVRLADLVRL